MDQGWIRRTSLRQVNIGTNWLQDFVKLRDVQFRRTLEVGVAQTEVLVQVSEAGRRAGESAPKNLMVEIVSAQKKSVVYASAEIASGRAAGKASALSVCLDEKLAASQSGSAEKDDDCDPRRMYERFRAGGFAYGPEFRRLEDIAFVRSDAGVVSHVAAAVTTSETHHSTLLCGVNAAVLDACTQVASLVHPAGFSGVPQRVREVVVRKSWGKNSVVTASNNLRILPNVGNTSCTSYVWENPKVKSALYGNAVDVVVRFGTDVVGADSTTPRVEISLEGFDMIVAGEQDFSGGIGEVVWERVGSLSDIVPTGETVLATPHRHLIVEESEESSVDESSGRRPYFLRVLEKNEAIVPKTLETLVGSDLQALVEDGKKCILWLPAELEGIVMNTRTVEELELPTFVSVLRTLAGVCGDVCFVSSIPDDENLDRLSLNLVLRMRGLSQCFDGAAEGAGTISGNASEYLKRFHYFRIDVDGNTVWRISGHKLFSDDTSTSVDNARPTTRQQFGDLHSEFRILPASGSKDVTCEIVPSVLPPPADHEVRIRTEAWGLNFLDVLMAKGVIDLGPDVTLGGECVGYIEAFGKDVNVADILGTRGRGTTPPVGAPVAAPLTTSSTAGGVGGGAGVRVVALTFGGWGSVVNVPAAFCCPIPEHISASAAVSVNLAYATAWLALVKCARLQKGESLLVHSGAGGVGLAALALGKHLSSSDGNETSDQESLLYATCGSATKRQFLLEQWGAKAVWSSRDASEFLGHARAAYAWGSSSDGRGGGKPSGGFDVVLNSLAGEEMLAASLQCVAPFGRFVEIGKRDQFENTAVGAMAFADGQQYMSAHLDVFMRRRPHEVQKMLREIWGLLEGGQLPFLPVTEFELFGGGGGEVDQQSSSGATLAMRYLSTGTHIGKVVVLNPILRVSEDEDHDSTVPQTDHLVVLGGREVDKVSLSDSFVRGIVEALASRLSVSSIVQLSSKKTLATRERSIIASGRKVWCVNFVREGAMYRRVPAFIDAALRRCRTETCHVVLPRLDSTGALLQRTAAASGDSLCQPRKSSCTALNFLCAGMVVEVTDCFDVPAAQIAHVVQVVLGGGRNASLQQSSGEIESIRRHIVIGPKSRYGNAFGVDENLFSCEQDIRSDELSTASTVESSGRDVASDSQVALDFLLGFVSAPEVDQEIPAHEKSLERFGIDSLATLQLAHALKKRGYTKASAGYLEERSSLSLQELAIELVGGGAVLREEDVARSEAGKSRRILEIAPVNVIVRRSFCPGGAEDGKPAKKILCLHGFRTSAEIFQMQLASVVQRFGSHMEFVLPDAPFRASGPPDPQLAQIFAREDLREWWCCPTAAASSGGEDEDHELPFLTAWNVKDDCRGLGRSVRFLRERVLAEYGPFDGVIGFSQGCAVAHALTLADPGFANQLKFRLFFSGVSFYGPDAELAEAGVESQRGVSGTPLIHVLDPSGDAFATEVDQLVAWMGKSTEERIHHGQGHEVPNLDSYPVVESRLADLLGSQDAGQGGHGGA